MGEIARRIAARHVQTMDLATMQPLSLSRVLKWIGLALCLFILGAGLVWPWGSGILAFLLLAIPVTAGYWATDLSLEKQRFICRLGKIASIVLAVIGLLSMVFGVHVCLSGWNLDLMAGCASLSHYSPGPTRPAAGVSLVSYPPIGDLRRVGFMAFFCHLLLPSCYNGPNVFSGSGWLTQVHCPLAVPFFLCAFPTVWLALRLRKAARTEHLCPTCKYDLTGNVSGRCPECGTVLAQGNEPQAAQPKKVSG